MKGWLFRIVQKRVGVKFLTFEFRTLLVDNVDTLTGEFYLFCLHVMISTNGVSGVVHG